VSFKGKNKRYDDRHQRRFEGYRKPYRKDDWRRKTERREPIEKQKIEPKPINGKCNPLCPLFWCGKRAYQPRRDRVTGRLFVFCTWIGDECIGASCQYAGCRMNYLMPDGSCGWVKQKSMETKRKEIFDEFEEDIDKKTKDLLSKRLGKSGLDDYY